jgi:hypothetical protein
LLVEPPPPLCAKALSGEREALRKLTLRKAAGFGQRRTDPADRYYLLYLVIYFFIGRTAKMNRGSSGLETVRGQDAIRQRSRIRITFLN